MADKMRKEFETWALSDFGLTPGHMRKNEDGSYVNIPTQGYWEVWQASRAVLVVVLPEDIKRAYHDRDEGWNDALDACRAAIKAAGVKVQV